MNISVKSLGEVLVLRPDETRLDAAVAVQFKDRMRSLIEDAPLNVVLDLSCVAFMDSSGLGAVAAVRKNIGSEKRFVLVGLTKAVQNVFKLTRMDSVFEIFETAEMAVK